jgi:hypothetical protein
VQRERKSSISLYTQTLHSSEDPRRIGETEVEDQEEMVAVVGENVVKVLWEE